MDSESAYVTFVVGGLLFSLNKAWINRFPGALLASLITTADTSKPIILERDGDLFYYICDYIRYRNFPRDRTGRLMIDGATRMRLKIEADFFQLSELAKECDEQDNSGPHCFPHMGIHAMIEDAISECKNLDQSKWMVPAEVIRLHEDGVSEPFKTYERFAKLLEHVTAPFCITGKLDNVVYDEEYYLVYKSSTINQINIDELLADAKLSAFGKGSETVIDTDVRQSYEIDLTESDTYNIKHDADITAYDRIDRDLDVRPYKLVIYKEGGHFEAHRDTVRGKGHIGTLVLILNSEYTGGELEVMHGGRTEMVTGPYSWVAMYGDCLHKINPVTSGTRVSLIYDIYSVSIGRYCWQPPQSIWNYPLGREIPPSVILRGADEANRQKIVEGMHEQLVGFDSAVICLQHLYPACQANPDFLKGGDQLLYDILRDHFTLAVLPCTIYRKKYFSGYEYGRNKSEYCVKPWRVPGLYDEHAALVEEAFNLKTNFIIFDQFSRKQIMEYEPIDYTGNEGQGEEMLYKVAGLQVRKRLE